MNDTFFVWYRALLLRNFFTHMKHTSMNYNRHLYTDMYNVNVQMHVVQNFHNNKKKIIFLKTIIVLRTKMYIAKLCYFTSESYIEI